MDDSFDHADERYLLLEKHFALGYLSLDLEGMLYELSSFFDGADKAIVKIDLRLKNVRVKGKTSKPIVEITYDIKVNDIPGTTEMTVTTSKKLYILFPNAGEMANFLRWTSDFTSTPVDTLQRGYKAPTNANTNRGPSGPVEHVRAAGTGNTKDVLSSTYGL